MLPPIKESGHLTRPCWGHMAQRGEFPSSRGVFDNSYSGGYIAHGIRYNNSTAKALGWNQASKLKNRPCPHLEKGGDVFKGGGKKERGGSQGNEWLVLVTPHYAEKWCFAGGPLWGNFQHEML